MAPDWEFEDEETPAAVYWEENEGTTEFWATDITGESFRFISEFRNGPLAREGEIVGLRLEFDSSASERVYFERLAREMKALEDHGATIMNYDPDEQYSEEGLVNGNDAVALFAYTEDRDELLDFIRTTNFYVDR